MYISNYIQFTIHEVAIHEILYVLLKFHVAKYIIPIIHVMCALCMYVFLLEEHYVLNTEHIKKILYIKSG